MGCSTFSSDDIVIKSPNDRRLYRFIRLDNGLSALLVHDPDIYPNPAPPKLTHCSDPEEEEEGDDAGEEDSDFDEDEYSEDDGFNDGEDDAEPGLSKRGENHLASSQTKKVPSLSLFHASSSCFSFYKFKLIRLIDA